MKIIELCLSFLIFIGCSNKDIDNNSSICKVGQTSVNGLGIYSLERYIT